MWGTLMQHKCRGSRPTGSKIERPPRHRRCHLLRATEQQKEPATLSLEGLLSDSRLEELTMEVLRNDPAAAAQLQRFEAAAVRVAKAQAALQDINLQIEQAASAKTSASDAEQKASEVMAAAEVKAAEKLMQAAELELAIAQATQTDYQRSVQRDADRVESGKAGAIAAVGGALSSAPLLLAGSIPDPLSLFLSFGATAASCILFGVTYRYAVREDLGDSHLRLGVVGAFGLVRGLAAADTLQSAAVMQGQNPLGLDVVGPGALAAGQSMLLFAAAATAVEVAFRNRWVKARSS